MAVLLLVHVPPDEASERVMVDPVHTVVGPVTLPAAGVAFTVMV